MTYRAFEQKENDVVVEDVKDGDEDDEDEDEDEDDVDGIFFFTRFDSLSCVDFVIGSVLFRDRISVK